MTAPKNNTLWKIAGITVPAVILIAGTITTWTIYGEDIEDNTKEIEVIKVEEAIQDEIVTQIRLEQKGMSKDIEHIKGGIDDIKAALRK